MMSSPWESRSALAVAVVAMVALTGCPAGTGAKPAPTPPPTPTGQALADALPCVLNSHFVISITNPLYGPASPPASVNYAEITNASGQKGYWLPVANSGPTIGQVLNGNTITVVFDTHTQFTPPGSTLPPPPIAPVIGPGSTICLKTNVAGDSCPSTPIKINPVTVTPCP